jgi:hypothetical protein
VSRLGVCNICTVLHAATTLLLETWLQKEVVNVEMIYRYFPNYVKALPLGTVM